MLCSLLGLEGSEDTVAMHSIKQRLIEHKRIYRIGMRLQKDTSTPSTPNISNTQPAIAIATGSGSVTASVPSNQHNKKTIANDSESQSKSQSQSIVFTVDYLLNPTSTNIDTSSDTG